jgi:hypothetical protein
MEKTGLVAAMVPEDILVVVVKGEEEMEKSAVRGWLQKGEEMTNEEWVAVVS